MSISTMVGNKDIISIVNILRRVTVIVKLYPFAYTLLYISCMLVYMFGSENASVFCDQMFYTSPFMVVCAIGLSYSLKLCKWHRLECILPLMPCIIVLVDTYIYQISMLGAYLNSILMLILCILSLINAYFVFIKPKQ